jgi:transposase-like protein
LLAIHLLASSKKGISAHQLHRNLGISYKGAWFMAHRLRWAMAHGGVTAMLGGTVEIDETYVGGRKRGGKRGRPGRESNKTPVVALVERGSGRVVAKPVYRVTADNLGKMLDQHVRHDATMMTDDFAAYKTLAEDSGRRHFTVKHQNEEWVNKDDKNIHSNTVEGFSRCSSAVSTARSTTSRVSTLGATAMSSPSATSGAKCQTAHAPRTSCLQPKASVSPTSSQRELAKAEREKWKREWGSQQLHFWSQNPYFRKSKKRQ